MSKVEWLTRSLEAGELLADYFLTGCAGHGWPDDIVLAVVHLYWPDRTFRIDDDEPSDASGAPDSISLYFFDAAIDIETGESAAELYEAEVLRLATRNNDAPAGR